MRKAIILCVVCQLLVFVLPTMAQEAPKPVPILTGYGGFLSTFEPHKQALNPTLNPILLVPLGKRFLVEAEFEMESDIEREDGMWGPRVLDKNVEYLQLDYLANRHLTVVVGRFLTPYGIFNERLHPSWVKNFQNTPMIFGLTHGSSTGGMLRGGITLSPSVNFNYAAYFSALSTTKMLEADRSAGGRWSLFFPKQRVEVGGSFNRRMVGDDERFNTFGFDFTWNVRPIPLDLRAEITRGMLGSGYWIEGGYRLNKITKWNSFFRRSQAVLRVEQFFAPDSGGTGSMGGEGGMVPDENTRRVWVGWNYQFREGFRFSAAYGRNITADSNRHIWSVGLAYRFLY